MLTVDHRSLPGNMNGVSRPGMARCVCGWTLQTSTAFACLMESFDGDGLDIDGLDVDGPSRQSTSRPATVSLCISALK